MSLPLLPTGRVPADIDDSDPVTMARAPTRPASILVVDDTIENLHLLETMLSSRGFRVRAARGGEAALRTISVSLPDLILLDIMMPGLDGYEVCRRLRASPHTRDIPVVVISALDRTTEKVRAFEAGAVDFITKPFFAEEVAARVSTHLHVHRLRAELQARHDAAARDYQRLRELERARDDLTHMIAHDMRSPLQTMMANAAVLTEELEGRLTADQATDLQHIVETGARLVELISDMLDVSRIERNAFPFSPSQVEIVALINKAVNTVGHDQRHRIRVGAERSPPVWCDPSLVLRVTENLLGNALRYAPPGSQISIDTDPRDRELCINVTDQGPCIPEQERNTIFEKYRQLDARSHAGNNSGVGLAFCRLAVERHGGRIGLSCTPPAGNTFWFTLPTTSRPPIAPPS